MKLSIVSIFCDNDYQLLSKLISNIREKVKVDYEIILIDNREKFKNESITLTDDIKIYSKGRNIYQFEARRYAVQFCHGDYIWFIDTDDSLLTVAENLSGITGNLICFSYAMRSASITLPSTWRDLKTYFTESNTVSVDKDVIERQHKFWDIIGSTLWNKWIKRDFLEEIIKDIPEDLEIVASEDILYSAICYDRTDKVTLCKESIYIYNYNLSKANSKEMTKERFFHIIKGRKTSRELFRKLLSDGEKYDNTGESVAYFLNKLYFCRTDRQDCLEEMKNHFTVEEIKDGVNHPWIGKMKDEAKLELYDMVDAL